MVRTTSKDDYLMIISRFHSFSTLFSIYKYVSEIRTKVYIMYEHRYILMLKLDNLININLKFNYLSFSVYVCVFVYRLYSIKWLFSNNGISQNDNMIIKLTFAYNFIYMYVSIVRLLNFHKNYYSHM